MTTTALNLTGLRNIYVEGESTEPPQPAEPVQPPVAQPETADVQGNTTKRARKLTVSPDEELAARCAKWGMPDAIPNELAFVMMCEKGEKVVEGNGIILTIEGRDYRYWHPDSRTCLHAVGTKISYVRARNYRDAIYLLNTDGSYNETLPLANTPDWFSTEAREELRKTRAVINHIHDELERNHIDDTRQAVKRARKTRDTLKAVTEIPVPALKSRTAADPSRAGVHAPEEGSNRLIAPQTPVDGGRPGFDRASGLVEAISDVGARRDSARASRRRSREVDVVEIFNRRGRAAEPAAR